jgi:two-component system OmpR family sensor kinase
MRSIRRQLLFWLLAIVLAGVALAGWLIYRQAQVEVNELFDYQLQQMAAALPSEPFSSVLRSRDQDEEGVVIQIWSRSGVQLYFSHPHAPLAPRAELGFSTERTVRGDWRVYSAIVGDNVVQLGQPMSVRNELAASVAWRTVWPLLVLLPILGILVWMTVGRGLRPLRRVERALDARHPEALNPLPEERLPSEVKPLVRALNGLLTRLATALDTQKAFVADAAHELRTPLAALKLQMQLLARADSADARREALDDLGRGVSRATHLVEQLLALARAEPSDSAAGVERGALPPDGAAADASRAARVAQAASVDLLALVKECVGAYAPLAADRHIDLGIETAEQASVPGDLEALRVMFNNLLDNALKYSPRGGRVDVSIHAPAPASGAAPAASVRGAGRAGRAGNVGSVGNVGNVGLRGAVVDIVDNGPGIAGAERERVFDRFYRGAAPGGGGTPSGERAAGGSGLGLAIVRRIAMRHEAHVELLDGADGRGLHVRVAFRPL